MMPHVIVFPLQAFKKVVQDPDAVLDELTREVKESGPEGEEVRK